MLKKNSTFRVLVLFAVLAAMQVRAENMADMVVTHGPAPKPTYVDNGSEGESAGDVRVWHFEGKTANDAVVTLDVIMTTTGLDTAGEGIESRITLGVFSFTGPATDQILVEGVGLYPGSAGTVKSHSELTRAIIGGTGKYKGARGEVVTVHKDDDTWEHIFKFSND